MKTLKDVDIRGKRVLIRADFNTPMDENQTITDDSRIRAVLPTIQYALDQGAKIILASHMGRPKGKPNPKYSMTPVANRLSQLIGKTVKTAPDSIGSEVRQLIDKMAEGDLMMLENLRFHPEEEKNDESFAKELASFCDVYVNDAFAVSHRVNASVCAITTYAPVSAAGMLLQKEMEYFEKIMTNPVRPLTAVIGGSKVSDKLKILENLMQLVDKFIIGGAMANTFLKSCGIHVGKSKVEDDLLDAANSILQSASKKGIPFYLPVDVVVALEMSPNAQRKTVPVQEIPPDWMALDIGPATSLLFEEALNDAKTIVWNGPLGVFEMEAFSRGTLSMVDCLANSSAITIIGGGDTDVAVHHAGKSDRMSYISTGGGAFLELLEGKKLPGVEALES